MKTTRQPGKPGVTHAYVLRALTVVSGLYMAAGVLWAYSGRGFPFGPDSDPTGQGQSILASVDHSAAWYVVLGLGALGVWTALVLQSPSLSRPARRRHSAVAAGQAILYAVLLPDGRPLVAAAHVPVLLAGKPFGWPGGVSISSQLPYPVLHQMFLMVLGVGWGIAAVVGLRTASGACARCGRGHRLSPLASPLAALRWGRWAVWIAMASPAAYASSRLAWAMDIPYGVTPAWLDAMRADEPTIFVAGAAMATLGLGGAALTFGLVASWGERWPSWVPGLRGRRIRPGVAMVPSFAVAVLLISAGKGWYVSAWAGQLPERLFGPQWATVVFGAMLPLWGLALGAAGYAYWLRRRDRCARCERGGIMPISADT